ncbi:unnamed protein product [Eruca vesicaria subsp. sativa]|uniref:Uncharacterized protein n=1 Tax=Eruca vesicaria subsp. sativa TaxID=29727 RepID=A0ABC8JMT2_ERUVS|nr:unnamed protein product [Eruca vesicaria subsp. sativa]
MEIYDGLRKANKKKFNKQGKKILISSSVRSALKRKKKLLSGRRGESLTWGKMRIRKNMKLSSMLLATAGYGGDKLETYVCPLNQSPWDVIPLTSSLDEDDGAAELTNLIDSSWFLPSPSSSSSPSFTHQFAGEDNVSLGDSNGAAQRFNGSVGNNHSLVSDERIHLIATERSPDVESSMNRSDDGSGNKSYPVELHSPVKTSGGDDYQAAVSVPAPPKRGRPRGSGKKAQASSTTAAASNNNPYEFYYYSGFGPRWGRKRGGGSGDEEKIVLTDNKNGGCEDNKKSNSSGEESYKTAAFEHGSSSFDGFEFMEEDYDDVVDQSIGGHAKKLKSTVKKMKRGRKPVKERSLKSLM